MDKEIFKNLINIIDNEIKLYTEMRNLYTDKKAALVKNDLDKLAVVDAKIIENYEGIKKIDALRLDAIKILGEDAPSMSRLIEIAEKRHPKSVVKLKEQQAQLEVLSSAISVLNLTTMKLIEHGMVLADKRLNIIVDACAPKGTSYTDKGSEKAQDMGMSTIIRDV